MTSWANYPPYWAKTGTLNLIGNILVIIDFIGNFSININLIINDKVA